VDPQLHERLAAEAAPCFVSSHLMSEWAHRGSPGTYRPRQLLADCTIEISSPAASDRPSGSPPHPDQLVKAVADAVCSAVNARTATLIVSGLVAAAVRRHPRSSRACGCTS